MKNLEFSQTIHAPAAKVWQTLWDEETYPIWTKYFNPDGSSMMKSDWKVGGKTFFTDENGNGMVSSIQSIQEPHEITFIHLGEVTDGVEDIVSEKVKSWAGALEKYKLEENNGITTLRASLSSGDGNMEEMMTNGFTKGFEEVKRLAEK